MGFLSSDEAFARFQKLGRNSSHFVWFLTEMKFYECANGWVFGYRQEGKVTLFAFEPLIPFSGEGAPISLGEFRAAWEEVAQVVRPKISFFVAVYGPFMEALKEAGFQVLQAGVEPYVALENCVPTGKKGKGVRAARNQALRAGVRVEEWTKVQIQAHPTLEREMREILGLWKSRNLLDMSGFVNTVNPFHKMEYRRYFMAFTERGLEAFLVATPIPANGSYFLEDLVIRPGATRGAGELLTLEAMVFLSESKARMASLGVVALANKETVSYGLPPLAKWVLLTLPKTLSRFYNLSGLEMFRKRFKPNVWENIYLALRNEPESGVSDSRAWFSALYALFGKSYKPKINFSWTWLKRTISRPFVKHPVSYFVAALTTLIFVFVNKGGHLSHHVLNMMGFTGSAPLLEWPLRSIVSDLLYFDFTHYALSTVLLLFLIRWMENTHRLSFVFWLTLGTSLLDDFINQLVLIRPYLYFHPAAFAKLVASKDVGTSLWLSTFLGLQLCALRRNREILFAIVSIGVLLCFVFSSAHIFALILNLNHFLFLSFGYIIGKIKVEFERAASRKVAAQKAPESKSTALAAAKRKQRVEEAALP